MEEKNKQMKLKEWFDLMIKMLENNIKLVIPYIDIKKSCGMYYVYFTIYYKQNQIIEINQIDNLTYILTKCNNILNEKEQIQYLEYLAKKIRNIINIRAEKELKYKNELKVEILKSIK